MKFNKTLFKLSFAFLCAWVAIGCTKTDESMDNREHGYGYVQFKLYKQGSSVDAEANSTRADQLDYLRDAHKVTLVLRRDNQTTNQSVLIEEADAGIAEFGIRTEKLKLMVGDYELIGYTIYNSVDKAILVNSLDEAIRVTVSQSKLLVQPLEVSVKPRGSFKFTIKKDLSKVEELTRAEGGLEGAFDEVAKVDLVLRNQHTGRSFSVSGLKSVFVVDGKGGSYLRCDSIVSAEAVRYQLERYTLWDNSNRVMTTADCKADEVYFEVEDNVTTEADVKVLISPVAPYIKDYIVLKKIWEDMHGEEWSWVGEGFPQGANWNFDKDIDLWGAQPGVYVHTNRRVAAINFGKFNPRGPVSEALGELDALVQLWFGTHNDQMRDDLSDPYRDGESYYSSWVRYTKGQHSPAEYRWELHKEEMRARHREARPSELFAANERKPEAAALWNSRKPSPDYDKTPVAVRPYADIDPGYMTNRITALPESIGKLTKLEALYIANGLVTEIPEGIKYCESLTDLEIYNCPKMTKFPKAIVEIPILTSLNIARNPSIPAREIEEGLDALFSGPSKGHLQILYCNGNNIEVFPASARNLKKLGLLDLEQNKIHTMPAMGDVALVQCYLGQNKLTSLPKDFFRTDDLESLDVSDNLLTEFPNIFGINTEYYMGSLNFSFNKIRKIAGYNTETMELEPDADGETFRGLKASRLNLSGNMLEGGFPAAFSLSNSDVSEYNLSYNNLDSIGAKGLKGLKFTTALDLSSNNIEKAPTLKQILIGQEMPFLTGVDLSYNAFKEFPETMFNGYGITTFFFSSQVGRLEGDVTYPCFTKWPDGIEQYAGLKVLKVDYNDIRQIRTFPANLNYLAVTGNNNISMVIPSDVCARMQTGAFGFEYETSQRGITGCPALGIDK